MKRIAAALLALVLLLAGCQNASPTVPEPSQTIPVPSDPSGIPDITVPQREAPFNEAPIWTAARSNFCKNASFQKLETAGEITKTRGFPR